MWFRVLDQSVASREAGPGRFVGLYFMVATFLLAVALARRHLRVGRGDRDGARRLALFGVFWAVVGNGPLKDPRVLEPTLVWPWLMASLLITVGVSVMYLALEPIVRRRWPDTLVSWTRLMRGRLLDPLVGRDVLVGVLGGVLLTFVDQTGRFASGANAWRWPASPKQLAGGWFVLADRVVDCGGGLLGSLLTLLLLAFLRQLLRRTWAAAAVTLGVLLALTALTGGRVLDLAINLVSNGIFLGLLIRPGLLAAAAALIVNAFLGDNLMTTHLGAWYAASAVSGILATFALAAWGFYAALGGRPLFGDPARDDV